MEKLLLEFPEEEIFVSEVIRFFANLLSMLLVFQIKIKIMKLGYRFPFRVQLFNHDLLIR